MLRKRERKIKTEGGVHSWMTKHYTKKSPELLICNYCRKSFSNQRDQRHILRNHLFDVHNVTELDGYPDSDIIRQNYKISGRIAICNHCEKTIFFTYGARYLKTHLKIDHPDKCNLPDRNIRTKSKMWDKFIVIGNYAMCKECKIKFRLHSIKPTRSLWQHLTTHHSDKYDVTDKSIKRRKSNVWKEYNVIGNYATCKRCKIKLRLHNIHPTHSLRRHLLIHHPNISNLNNRKLSRSNVWKEYNITGNYAICKECNREIRLPNLNPTRYLWNHLKLDHPYKQTVPDMTNKKRYSDMWDQYIIKGDMITCKKM